jgi:hypothetical protein
MVTTTPPKQHFATKCGVLPPPAVAQLTPLG